jgi:ATP-binding cassette subfamily B protein
MQAYLMAGVSQRVVYEIRREVMEKLERLPVTYFDTHPHGEVMSRFVNDFDNISSTLQQSLVGTITAVVTFLGVIVMMLSISTILTVVVAVTLPLSFAVTRGVARRSQKFFLERQRELGRLNGHVEEMYTGHVIVKAFGHEQRAIGEFEDINRRLYVWTWKAQFMTGIIMPLMNVIGNLGYVLVSVIGGILVTRRRIQIGDIQAFIQYARLFSQPITQLSSISNQIQSALASSERVFEILDETEETPESEPAKHVSGERTVAFDHVSFRYRADRPLIEDLDIHVQAGEMVAIVGPTGAGKTTLVNLLMRFYDLDGGRIIVGGTDITRLPRSELRRQFGMVLQDTWLFYGTIRDNIAYGREEASEEEIVRAAQAAHADHFIRTQPDGYDTLLNEEASNISQGQRQLITIARAFLADPPMLILDEATSSVDTRTEMAIQRGMKSLMHGRTSFVIAHRLSTIREADHILVMNHGRLVEQGTHAELISRGGFYADLYQSQFEGREEVVEAAL